MEQAYVSAIVRPVVRRFATPLWIALLASALVGFVSYPPLVFELHRLRARKGRHERAAERLRKVIGRR